MAGATDHREAPQRQVPTQPPSQEPVGVRYRRSPGSGPAMAAWIVIGLEPIAVVAAFLIGAAIGLSEESGSPVSIWGHLLSFLILVVAPTVALPLAFQATRWGWRSGIVALAVSATLLAAALAFIAYLGWIVEWVIPWTFVAGSLTSLMWIFGKKPPQPTPPRRSRLASTVWHALVLMELIGLLVAYALAWWLASYEAEAGYAGIGWRLLIALALVVAPTATLPLAFHSARWGSLSGKLALAVSGLLLVATLVLLGVMGFFLEWIIVWVLVTGLLLFLVWMFGKKPSAKPES